MLNHLVIKNYALISGVDLDFTPGLTIVTGETGAGKSIMLGALSLLTGARADVKAISDRDSKAVVEAEFTCLPPHISDVIAAEGIESDPSMLILRREITPSGRSRAFVNDTPVTLSSLSKIASHLIDIHTQHSNVVLLQPEMQLRLLDSYAGNEALVAEYHSLFQSYVDVRRAIKRIRTQIEREAEKKDFIAFQLEQLAKLNPKQGELAQIEREFDMLSDADEIRDKLGEVYSLLEASEGSAVSAVSSSAELLDDAQLNFTGEEEGAALAARLREVAVEIKDIAETVESFLDKVHADPARLARLSARMNRLYEAQKHFKVVDEDGLVELYRSLQERMDSISGGDVRLDELEKEARTIARSLKREAARLSESRREAAPKLAEAIRETARPLGLPNIRFEIELRDVKPGPEGQESVDFLCSFNKNNQLQPVASVASGGEIARVMLSLKAVMAASASLPTVIFDEIDTGVSGEIADRMGSMMAEMGERMQVMTITHLPQVAAKGGSHFKVYKRDEENRTVTHVKRLGREEREREIAGMLSGSVINDAAIDAARALLVN